MIPPSLLIGRRTPGSMIFLSSLIASSLTQNRTPSMIASTPVFLPLVALLSNSCVLNSFPSTEKTASLTLDGLTSVQGAGVRPVSAHSEVPNGALMEQALAASMKCSEIMFIVHSFVEVRLARVSFAFENPPAKPTMNSGGSWFMTWVYEKGARLVDLPGQWTRSAAVEADEAVIQGKK